MKLKASRGVDIGDLSRILGGANETELLEVRRTVKQHLPDATEDLESLITLARLLHQF